VVTIGSKACESWQDITVTFKKHFCRKIVTFETAIEVIRKVFSILSWKLGAMIRQTLNG
jgi:hypothetical protein